MGRPGGEWAAGRKAKFTEDKEHREVVRQEGARARQPAASAANYSGRVHRTSREVRLK